MAGGRMGIPTRTAMSDKAVDEEGRKISAEFADLDSRLRALSGEADGKSGGGKVEGPDNPSGAGAAMRMGTDLVAALAVGGAIGYALDRWLGTKPAFLLVFLLLGAVAGFLNVYRVAKGLDGAVGLGRAIEEKKRRDAAQDHGSRPNADTERKG